MYLFNSRDGQSSSNAGYSIYKMQTDSSSAINRFYNSHILHRINQKRLTAMLFIIMRSKLISLSLTANAVFGISLIFANSAIAQTVSNPDSALIIALGNIEGARLSLTEAEQSASSSATSIHIAEAQNLGAHGSVRRERGAFDPELFINLSQNDQKEPTASFFSGAPILHTKQTTSSSGLRMDLPTGTSFELSLNTIRLQTNSSFAFLNPEFDAFETLSIRQPLLRGFTSSGRKLLNQSEWLYDAETDRYNQQVIGTIADVDRSYWDLYAAEHDYAVQMLSRDRAKSFLDETEKRAKAGIIGMNQVASARTFLAEQELTLLDSEEQFDSQSDRLASLIGMRPKGGTTRFVPADEPPVKFNIEPVDVLVDRALKNNRDLDASRHIIEAMKSQADAAFWEALPSLDLVGSVGGNGLSGTPQTVIFGGDTLLTTRSGNFSNAINQAIKRKYPGWSIGFEMSIPIGLRKGLGEKERLRSVVMVAQQQYIEESRTLEEQVRESYRQLLHGQDRLAAANDEVIAAQDQIRIGMIEFQNGRSTAFELVRLAEDLALAQRRYSETQVLTAKAAVTLQQLTSDKSILSNIN
jgi:outer membrane protein TolC